MATRSHDNRWFAALYGRTARSATFRREIDPWRARLAAAARGVVLEVGAGGGQNFAFYHPEITTRVEAVEPNGFMRQQAEAAARVAAVPIHLTAATAEALPFADATFDTVAAALVFCSVDAPARALAEIARVLKPDGTLVLFEHVRSRQPILAGIQRALTPVQRRVAGNCHLDRDTAAAVRAAGFTIDTTEWSGGGIHPQIFLVAHGR